MTDPVLTPLCQKYILCWPSVAHVLQYLQYKNARPDYLKVGPIALLGGGFPAGAVAAICLSVPMRSSTRRVWTAPTALIGALQARL